MERRSVTTELMEKAYIALFANLGESPTVTNISGFEAFVCELYRKPKTNSTSAVRFAIFHDKYAPTNMASPLDKLRGAIQVHRCLPVQCLSRRLEDPITCHTCGRRQQTSICLI